MADSNPAAEITLQTLRSHDMDSLIQVWHDSKKIAFPYVAVQQSYTKDQDREYFINAILPNCQVWTAFCGRELIGFMALEGSTLDLLFVKVGWQRQGVGTALIKKAKDLYPGGLKAYTFQKNLPSREFFNQHGFKIIQEGISPAPENEPDFLLAWKPKY